LWFIGAGCLHRLHLASRQDCATRAVFMNTESPIAPRVLLAVESLPFRRVIREALMAFRHCEVDDTPSAEHAFELALGRRYALYVFALSLPDMRGDLLDRLLVKACPLVHQGSHTAPPIIYLLKPDEALAWQELSRSARVRGHVFTPPRLDVLIQATSGLLPERNPTMP
jgi:DNA-binding NarL/FixJ family response regulator